MMNLRLAPLLAALALSACASVSPGIDLHNNPPQEVQKETGPLTVPPADLTRQPPR